MLEYRVVCKILHGELFKGIRVPITTNKTYHVEAENDEDAYKAAITEMESIIYDYKPSPATGLTMILLDSIKDKNRKIPIKLDDSIVKINKWDYFLYTVFGYIKR